MQNNKQFSNSRLNVLRFHETDAIISNSQIWLDFLRFHEIMMQSFRQYSIQLLSNQIQILPAQ